MEKKLKYTDEVDESWADKAIDTVNVSASPDAERPVVLDLEGHCPRCKHAIADSHWLLTFSGVSGMDRADTIRTFESLRDAGAIRSPLLPAEFTVRCNCREAHPDLLRRTGLSGCGAVWRMRFEASEDTE